MHPYAAQPAISSSIVRYSIHDNDYSYNADKGIARAATYILYTDSPIYSEIGITVFGKEQRPSHSIAILSPI